MTIGKICNAKSNSGAADRFNPTETVDHTGFIDSATRWTLAAAMWMTIALLIYASIVPLDFSPMPFDAAIASLKYPRVGHPLSLLVTEVQINL